MDDQEKAPRKFAICDAGGRPYDIRLDETAARTAAEIHNRNTGTARFVRRYDGDELGETIWSSTGANAPEVEAVEGQATPSAGSETGDAQTAKGKNKPPSAAELKKAEAAARAAAKQKVDAEAKAAAEAKAKQEAEEKAALEAKEAEERAAKEAEEKAKQDADAAAKDAEEKAALEAKQAEEKAAQEKASGAGKKKGGGAVDEDRT